MKPLKLCACITGKDAGSCVEMARKTDTELVEHRMDFMEKIEKLSDIYGAATVPVIATNRSGSCGGNFKGGEDERIGYLLDAIDSGCAMVDIEIETAPELKEKVIRKAKEAGCKVIISMHDFEKTPPADVLIEVMKKQRMQGAGMGKIVTTAKSMEDCHRILGIMLLAKKENFPLVAFAMGDTGKITRIASLLYGAPFMYASLGEKAGPGQLSVKEMKEILKRLGG